MAKHLVNKHILLGITGSIAAYKGADLIRKLKDQGAEVQVIMTHSAKKFITPLTLQALSGLPVRDELMDIHAEAAMGHIELARWADLLMIAPASADFIATLASGQGKDLLSTVCLASSSPIAIAPAMNQQMWHSQATQENVLTLKNRGVSFFGPDIGEQACGDVGAGRMMEPETLAKLVAQLFDAGDLEGRHVVITAGPTREAIDPVRFLSNRSSGKMGYALAQAALDAGAKVTLISGPTALDPPKGVNTIQVISAEEMLNAVMAHIQSAHIFISNAAVADYTPIQVSEQKMKKSEDSLIIKLKKTRDILREVADLPNRPLCVGFSAETESLMAGTVKKLKQKNLDIIIGNQVGNQLGFDKEEIELLVLTCENDPITLSKGKKHHQARILMRLISEADKERRHV